jgi:hypothetical protein
MTPRQLLCQMNSPLAAPDVRDCACRRLVTILTGAYMDQRTTEVTEDLGALDLTRLSTVEQRVTGMHEGLGMAQSRLMKLAQLSTDPGATCTALDVKEIQAASRMLCKLQDLYTGAMNDIKTLRKDQVRLMALEAAGVDNWDGYDQAMEAVIEPA